MHQPETVIHCFYNDGNRRPEMAEHRRTGFQKSGQSLAWCIWNTLPPYFFQYPSHWKQSKSYFIKYFFVPNCRNFPLYISDGQGASVRRHPGTSSREVFPWLNGIDGKRGWREQTENLFFVSILLKQIANLFHIRQLLHSVRTLFLKQSTCNCL